jgi:hypothetical protein
LFPGQAVAQFLDGAHQRGREHHRGVLIHADLDQALEVAQLQGQGVGHHDVGGDPKLIGGQRLALGGDDLGPLLALGLGQGLVKGVLADHLSQGGLGDLVDGRGHVLDRDHCLGRGRTRTSSPAATASAASSGITPLADGGRDGVVGGGVLPWAWDGSS